jgi:hypothetical protein
VEATARATAEDRVRVTRLSTDSARALAALAGCVGFYVVQFAMFPTTDDQDAGIHTLLSSPPVHASALLTVFARPVFATLYVIPGMSGYMAMRVLTLIVCAATAWMTYLAARKLELPVPWLAIPLVLLQPALCELGTEVMTEPTFALVLAGGTLALTAGHRRSAALVWSFLPLARPEGPIVLGVVGALWLVEMRRDRTVWRSILLLGTGSVAWVAVCYLTLHDPWYLRRTFPWAVNTSAIHGSAWHYVVRWPVIIGFGVLPLWIAGAFAEWRRPVIRLALLSTLAVLVVHSYLWSVGRFASWGFDRYFATLAPFTALVAAAGVSWFTRLGPLTLRRLLATGLVVQAIQAFGYVDSNPANYAGIPTRRLVATAQAVVGLTGRRFISADHFGYVFTGTMPIRRLPGDSAQAAALMHAQPPGTVVLWDDRTGLWWYHLTVESLEAAGYRVAWMQRERLGSPRAGAYQWIRRGVPWLFSGVGWNDPLGTVREAVLVRE